LVIYIKSQKTAEEVSMGKKSLTKSTTKKKKITEKKPSSQAAETAPESAKAPLKKTDNPEPATADKKKPAAKKPTIKALLKKDFGTWVPAALFSVSPDETSAGQYTAPPFIDETDPAKAGAMRALLAKQFDLTKVEAPEPPKKPAATPKKKPPAEKEAAPKVEKPVETPAPKKTLSIPELLNLKFESWQPEKLFTPAVDPARQPVFSAPPVVNTANAEEAAKIKALLAKQFDLSVVEILEPPVMEAPKTEEPPQAIAEPIVEPVAEPVVQPVEEPVAVKAPEAPQPASKPAPEPKKPAPVVEPPKPVEEKTPAAAEPAKPVEPPKKEEKKEPETPKAEIKPEIKKEAPKAPDKPVPKPAPKPSPEKAPAPPAPVEPPAAAKQPEMISGPIKMLIACVAAIFGLLILASAMNTSKYYLKPAENAVEIWQGSFSPSGQKLLISVPDAVIPEPVQSVYTKKQALVPAFDYYIKKAEALTETKGQPDFEAIKSELAKAIAFAPSTLHQKDAKNRLNKIECLFLIYKADVAAGKGTLEGYESAINDLNRAKTLGVEGPQKALVDEKLEKLNKTKAMLMKKSEIPSKVTVPLKKHAAEPKPH
jgi:hypothetical protein